MEVDQLVRPISYSWWALCLKADRLHAMPAQAAHWRPVASRLTETGRVAALFVTNATGPRVQVILFHPVGSGVPGPSGLNLVLGSLPDITFRALPGSAHVT